MVKTAYQPAFNSLNQERNLENGILTKQEADNQYYQEWLDSKSNMLMANQNSVDQATNNMLAGLTGNQATQLAGETQNLTNEANARPGNVSNNAPAFTAGESAMGNYLDSNRAAAETELGGAVNQAASVEKTNSNALGEAIANTGAVVAAGGAKEQAAYNAAMDKIASASAALSSKEASSLVGEISKLQGTQIALSENNRNYNTAVAKLGISEANTRSEIAARAATTKLNQAKFNETINQNNFNDWYKNQQLGQNAQKIAIALSNSNANIAYKAFEEATKKGGALSPAGQDAIYKQIATATGTIDSLMTKNGLTPVQAYRAVLAGYFVTTNGKKTVKISVPRMANEQFLNAAFNARSGGQGLTAGDVAALTKWGLTDVSNRLPVAANGVATITQGGKNSPH